MGKVIPNNSFPKAARTSGWGGSAGMELGLNLAPWGCPAPASPGLRSLHLAQQTSSITILTGACGLGSLLHTWGALAARAPPGPWPCPSPFLSFPPCGHTHIYHLRHPESSSSQEGPATTRPSNSRRRTRKFWGEIQNEILKNKPGQANAISLRCPAPRPAVNPRRFLQWTSAVHHV